MSWPWDEDLKKARAKEERLKASSEKFQRNAASAGQGLTLVPISAQLELALPLPLNLSLLCPPYDPKLTRKCVPKVLKLSSNVSDVSRRSSS
jgi:hypothetical protein